MKNDGGSESSGSLWTSKDKKTKAQGAAAAAKKAQQEKEARRMAQLQELREYRAKTEAAEAARAKQPNRMTQAIDAIEEKYVGRKVRALGRDELPSRDAGDADDDDDADDDGVVDLNETDDEDEDEEEDEEGDSMDGALVDVAADEDEDEDGVDEEEAGLVDVTAAIRAGTYRPNAATIDKECFDATVDDDIEYDDDGNMISEGEARFGRLVQYELLKWCFTRHAKIFDTPADDPVDGALVEELREDRSVARDVYREASQLFVAAVEYVKEVSPHANFHAIANLVYVSAHLTVRELPATRPQDAGELAVCAMRGLPIAAGERGYVVLFTIDQTKNVTDVPITPAAAAAAAADKGRFVEATLVLDEPSMRLTAALFFVAHLRSIVNRDICRRLAAYFAEDRRRSPFYYYAAYQNDRRKWPAFLHHHYERACAIIRASLGLVNPASLIP